MSEMITLVISNCGLIELLWNTATANESECIHRPSSYGSWVCTPQYDIFKYEHITIIYDSPNLETKQMLPSCRVNRTHGAIRFLQWNQLRK